MCSYGEWEIYSSVKMNCNAREYMPCFFHLNDDVICFALCWTNSICQIYALIKPNWLPMRYAHPPNKWTWYCLCKAIPLAVGLHVTRTQTPSISPSRINEMLFNNYFMIIGFIFAGVYFSLATFDVFSVCFFLLLLVCPLVDFPLSLCILWISIE